MISSSLGMENLGFDMSCPDVASARKGTAVSVQNGYKSYGKKGPGVLKGLSMTVEQGSIYSLLGSSGCGKTTLLSCIVGLKRLDSGDIRVFGETPGTQASGIPGAVVGHMPQEYALYPDFSVEESLKYFGLLYGMPSERIRDRSAFLLKTLDLPWKGRRVGTLSGGQKRRVSLAVALIHEPRLLILDEPTVGVDQLLRESIWNLLRDLVNSKSATVIITTHYIEESRASDKIGFLRGGRLLAESNPSSLLQRFGSTSLEDVILELSKADSKTEADGETENLDKVEVEKETLALSKTPSTNTNDKLEKEDYSNSFSFSRFRALLTKDIQLLLRNYIFLLFNFLTPSLQIIVACLCLGNDPLNLPFGLVNFESNCHSSSINNTSFLVDNTSCKPSEWSCIFVSEFTKKEFIELESFPKVEEALDLVSKGRLWGYLEIPANFSRHLYERQLANLNPTNEDVEGSQILLRMDHSSDIVNSLLRKHFLQSFTDFSKLILSSCGFDERAADLPLTIGEPLFGKRDTNYREYLAPSLLLAVLFFLPLSASGISYIADRKAGTLDRAMVAGTTTMEIMLASTLTQIFVLFVQSTLSLVIMTTLFSISVAGSFPLALLLCILIGVSGMSMGFLVASIVTEEVQAVIIAIGTFFPNFALAGIVWPVESMPLILQYVGLLLPCSLASEAMRSIVSRGVGLTHAKVWPGFVATFGWILFYWGIAIFVLKITNRRR